MTEPSADDVEWLGTVLVEAGAGAASVVRIPIPGTNGLCIQLDAPGGYKGSTSTLFFVEDPKQKFGRQLRLDYGPRPTTVNGQKVTVIDYHWNQKGTMAEFGIPDHSPTSAIGPYLHRAAINENGARYTFAYDAMGRLIEERDFDGQVTRYRHEPRATRQQTGHWALQHEYDALGRLLRRQAEQLELCGDGYLRPIANQKEQIETFQYDAAGRLVAACNAHARLQWFYDPVGNAVREHHHHDFLREVPCHVWQHEYDELDQRVATVRPHGQRQQWLTYGSGHVHGLMLGEQELVGFERDPLHRETTRIQANGLTQHSVYDPAGRLKQRRYGATPQRQGQEPGTVPPVGVRSIARDYEYDPSGQLQTINDVRRGLLAYKYDPVGRLVQARSGLGQETFEFDPAGNLLGPSAPGSAPDPAPALALRDNLLRSLGDTFAPSPTRRSSSRPSSTTRRGV